MKITISGPPGSGKTTVAKMVARKLNYPLISGGNIFREMASKMGMNLVEFSKYAEKNHSIDIMIDKKIIEMAKKEKHVVIDSRLSGWLMVKNGIEAFKVFIDASPETRAERLLKRDGGKFEDVYKSMILREKSEKKRYREIYGIDFDEKSIYDLVIQSDDLNPDEITKKIIREAANES